MALSLLEEFRKHFWLYYWTQFYVRERAVREEIQRQVDRDGGLWRWPWLEIRPDYIDDDQPLLQSLAPFNLGEELAKGLASGLFGDAATQPDFRPRRHQADALRAIEQDADLLITGGTGSGKTEAFLLPVLAGILREATGWPDTAYPLTDWWRSRDAVEFHRSAEPVARPAAVRALVVYPTNSLVEDQMGRLRSCLRAVNAALSVEGEKRVFLGRYTGETASREDFANAPKLRSVLLDIDAERDRVQSLYAGEPALIDKLSQVPQIDTFEMRSRQDMIESPPDILVTNFSMLRLMLLRGDEAPIWEKTREWIESGGRFHLIIDEVHGQRGTGGTEVAYLLRALSDRLGLAGARRQTARFIGVSASLENANLGRQFAEDLFGSPPGSVAVVTAEPDWPSLRASLNAQAGPIGQVAAALLDDLVPPGAAGQVARPLDRDLIGNPGGLLEAVPAPVLSAAVAALGDPAISPDDLVLNAARVAGLRLRLHLLMQGHSGVWACANLACQGPRVSASISTIATSPRLSCESCGGRMLELLYCMSCGVTLFGGFALDAGGEVQQEPFTLGDHQRRYFTGYVGASGSPVDRPATSYRPYWPKVNGATPPPNYADGAQRTSDNGAVIAQGSWVPVAFDALAGELRSVPADQASGWAFEWSYADGQQVDPPDWLSALPTQCPGCHTDWEKQFGAGGGPRSLRDRERLNTSPIRGMRPRWRKFVQLCVDRFIDLQDDDARRSIVFSDSRQEAARLSADIVREHWLDSARALIISQLEYSPAALEERLAAAKVLIQSQLGLGPIPIGQVVAAGNLLGANVVEQLTAQAGNPAYNAKVVLAAPSFGALADAGETATATMLAERPPVSLATLVNELRGRLYDLGLDPIGPDAEEPDWWVLPGLSASKVAQKDQNLAYLSDVEPGALEDNVLTVVSGGAGKAIEALGLGVVIPRTWEHAPPPAGPNTEAWQAVIRLMLRNRIDVPNHPTLVAVPEREVSRRVKRYLLKVFHHQGWPMPHAGCPTCASGDYCARGGQAAYDQLRAHANFGDATLAPGATSYLDFSRLAVSGSAGRVAYECSRCRFKALHECGGVCPECLAVGSLQAVNLGGQEPANLYAVLARRGGSNLRAEELSAQQSPAIQRDRQRWFADPVDELPQIQRLGRFPEPPIEVLSVTTTMEAGVDIGNLPAVFLANVPPERFNYQQRVGRAGRRTEPLSFAVTVARDRSHDSAHFSDPAELITGRVRPPFVDLRFDLILKRVLAEVATAAAVRSHPLPHRGGDDKYLGTVASWEDSEGLAGVRSLLQHWLLTPESALKVEGLVVATPHQANDLTAWLTNQLVGELDAAVQDCPAGLGPDTDLAEWFQVRGKFPLYGMPTDVRSIWLHRPRHRGELYVDRVQRGNKWVTSRISRDVSYAVSEFSPGREMIVDKKLFAVAGPVRYTAQGAQIISLDQIALLARRDELVYCEDCLYASYGWGNQINCPVCGHPFQAMAANGAGPRPSQLMLSVHDFPEFRSDFVSRRYTGAVSRGAGLGPPVLIERGDHQEGAQVTNWARATLMVDRSPTRAVVTLNHNRRQGFVLREAYNRAGHPDGLTLDGTGPATTPLSLGHRRVTDVLRVRFDDEARLHREEGISVGWSVHESTSSWALARRAAWSSFAHLLRQSAAAALGIYLDEFEARARVTRSAPICQALGDIRQQGEAFLADRLDNGAGYASWFGGQGAALFGSMSSVVGLWHGGEASKACDSSCPKCLLEYSNQYEYGHLDWRLAHNLLEILTSGTLSNGSWLPFAESLVTSMCTSPALTGSQISRVAGLPALEVRHQNKLVYIWSPFFDGANENGRPSCLDHGPFSDALQDLEGRRLAGGMQRQDIDWYSLVRRPTKLLVALR